MPSQKNSLKEACCDRKRRFSSLLENPYLSRIQRNLLDGGREENLQKIVQDLPYKTLLDIGCGLGEYSVLNKENYIGIDNSFLSIKYASDHYRSFHFFVADANQLPFKNNSFDMTMLVDAAHHLNDKEFSQVLKEMKRISKTYILICDAVVVPYQSKLSRFFYKLDRGACMRNIKHMQTILSFQNGLKIQEPVLFKTFPGLYIHAVFIMEIMQ